MTLQEWNQRQIDEARGEVNRYFFHEHYGRNAESDDELILYYIEFGGASHYRNENNTEEYDRKQAASAYIHAGQ